ncbi:hypothetical protein SADUNF_Sadunf10G0194200 [Salix dunnii]|uniref:Uncharacterized protein n=1 Tax=Salix dunnii TaxID=1413687 RepID=A0A835MRK6_9ROSI|nr:hypothetical protein SADUNF_Sadunf10G0194200 [Salix dunnii]
MTYITYSNICANLVRNCLKEPYKTEALSREKVHFSVTKFVDGNPQKPGRGSDIKLFVRILGLNELTLNAQWRIFLNELSSTCQSDSQNLKMRNGVYMAVTSRILLKDTVKTLIVLISFSVQGRTDDIHYQLQSRTSPRNPVMGNVLASPFTGSVKGPEDSVEEFTRNTIRLND